MSIYYVKGETHSDGNCPWTLKCPSATEFFIVVSLMLLLFCLLTAYCTYYYY